MSSKSNKQLVRTTRLSPRKFGENGKRAKQARNTAVARAAEINGQIDDLTVRANISLIAAVVTIVAAFSLVLAGFVYTGAAMILASIALRCYYGYVQNKIEDLELGL